MIKAGVVGASGYTGAELMRILWGHPGREVAVTTAASYAGTRIASLYPSLEGYYDGDFSEFSAGEVAATCDVAFVALPHGESMPVVRELLDGGLKVVDLSADFRFDSVETYEGTYGVEHSCPGLCEAASYGLPEAYRDRIADSSLVAVPGCYPTAALLALMPLAKSGLLAAPVIVDAKSGVSGAGRKATLETHYPQASDGIKPYAVGSHRHQPEIAERLQSMGGPPGVLFAPHLAPMDRGILATVYAGVSEDLNQGDLVSMYSGAYAEEPFVTLLPAGTFPQTKAVRGCNECHVSVMVAGGGLVVLMSVIDNLVKGASGGAVQCMNIMCGLPETQGLKTPGVFP